MKRLKFHLKTIADPIVRSELMEQVAHIAVYCHENNDALVVFNSAIATYILPMVVRYLDDANNQVEILNLYCSLYTNYSWP